MLIHAKRLAAAIAAAALLGGGGNPGGFANHPHPPNPHHRMNSIPQHNGGDHDSDNNGGPSDGDGNI
jgi:hypothetical protein